MSSQTAARITVRNSLIELVECNRQFREAVESDHGLPVWIMDTDSEVACQRSLAAEVTTRLTYTEAQSKQETVRITGLVGTSMDTLRLGEKLNIFRARFKVAITNFRKLFGDSMSAIEQASDDLRDGLLGGLQVKHLHFIQCYRQIKLFDVSPSRIGFSWASSHSGSVKVTAKKAIDHLKKKYINSIAIGEDIRLLEQMPSDEVVIIKRQLAPHLRANITWPKQIESARQTNEIDKRKYPKQINTPLPLFVYLQPQEALPEFNRIRPYDPSGKQERLKRNDARLVKISDNPFSRIYRYV